MVCSDVSLALAGFWPVWVCNVGVKATIIPIYRIFQYYFTVLYGVTDQYYCNFRSETSFFLVATCTFRKVSADGKLI